MISVLLMTKKTVGTVVEIKRTMFEFAWFSCINKKNALPVAVSIQENTLLVVNLLMAVWHCS